MHWSTVLYKAAERFDGGARSFPLADEDEIAAEYRYEPPNEDYERLFFRCGKPMSAETRRARASQVKRGASPHSAGWWLPDGDLLCKPVFVAHSTLAAIWLLREMLGDDVVGADDWCRLVRAAEGLTDKSEDDARRRGADQGSSALANAEREQDEVEELPLELAEELYRNLADNGDDGSEPPSAQVPSSSRAGTLKRTALPAPEQCAKRRREEFGHSPVSLRASSPMQNVNALTEQLVTKITNNNRRAEVRRNKARDASRARDRERRGLQHPGSGSSLEELTAYEKLKPEDEATVSWVFTQRYNDRAGNDFWHGSPQPYATAIDIIEKARELGNDSALYAGAQFLTTWRREGSPFGTTADGRQLVQGSQPQWSLTTSTSQLNSADHAFRHAWSMCRRYDAALAAVHIGWRWAFALLGQAYAQKVQQITEDDAAASNDRTRNRYGKGQVKSEAIAYLIKLVYPTPTKRDHEVFRNRLKQAMRWHTIVVGLGWGSLLLIPQEKISNWWLERRLRTGQLDVFIALVQHKHPELCAASKEFENWLGPDGIAGGPIGDKTQLSLEQMVPALSNRITEVKDSDDEEDDDDDDDDDNDDNNNNNNNSGNNPDDNSVSVKVLGRTADSSAVDGCAQAPAPLRQMTILELLKPAGST